MDITDQLNLQFIDFDCDYDFNETVMTLKRLWGFSDPHTNYFNRVCREVMRLNEQCPEKPFTQAQLIEAKNAALHLPDGANAVMRQQAIKKQNREEALCLLGLPNNASDIEIKRKFRAEIRKRVIRTALG